MEADQAVDQEAELEVIVEVDLALRAVLVQVANQAVAPIAEVNRAAAVQTVAQRRRRKREKENSMQSIQMRISLPISSI